jgi:hypothetical protein
MAKRINKNGLTPLLLLLSRAAAAGGSTHGYRSNAARYGYSPAVVEQPVSEIEKEFAEPLMSDEEKTVQFLTEFVEFLNVDLNQTVPHSLWVWKPLLKERLLSGLCAEA